MNQKAKDPRDGDFIGSTMSARFLKETVDLAHCRGYAVLIERVTSADAPDKQAVYNMYQVDADNVKADIKARQQPHYGKVKHA